MSFNTKHLKIFLAAVLSFGLTSACVQSAQVVLAWDAPTHNLDGTPIENLAGYKVYYGDTSSDYDTCLNIGSGTMASIPDLVEGRQYFFSATTYNTDGIESPFSDEFSWSVPDQTPPTIVSAPDNMALPADDQGQATLPDLRAQVVTRDNCSGPEQIVVTQSPAPGSVLGLGTETITFTVADAAGNQASRTGSLTVSDEAFSVRRPVLSWDAVDGATWYYLWINRNGKTYLHKWLNQESTTWVSDVDMPAGEYTWWVRGWSAETGLAGWSSAASFAIARNIPGPAALHAPEGQIHTDRLDCSWDTTEHAAWYYVWINRGSGNFAKKWVNETSFSTGSGLPYGSYTWWVRTWGTDGYGPWSTSKTCSYGVVELQSPNGVVEGTRQPTFTWTSLEEAESYQIWVTRNGRKYASATVLDATWTPESELPGGTYKWWVRISGANGNGPWSSCMTFTLPAAPTEVIVGL